MKTIMKLYFITMPLVCGSMYSAEPHRVQILTLQEEIDQHIKNIKETNDGRAKALYKAAVGNYMAEGKHVPARYLKHVDQETLILAQQHNKKLFEGLQK